MEDFNRQALLYEAEHVRYWTAKEQALLSKLAHASAMKRHHQNELAKLQRMIENEGREGNGITNKSEKDA